MIKNSFPLEKFKSIDTPFYFYDTVLLNKTLELVKKEINKYGYHQHYAIKANNNPQILKIIASKGFGADCVSGNEVRMAIEAGFPKAKIVFAGVGKTDKEIEFAMDNDIFCFNVESISEMQAISDIAKRKNKIQDIALRINPNVDAHTHEYITTGLSENKFGFDFQQLEGVLQEIEKSRNIKLIGIHFHIGSQIEDVNSYIALCERANELQDYFQRKDIELEHINLGGGLGINYDNPDDALIPPFEKFFNLFDKHLKIKQNQAIHFELGRAIVGQCGTLISRVVHMKSGLKKQFAILDAGMTELIRPALYGAKHKIENISADTAEMGVYDIVGPICESTDTFAKDYTIAKMKRDDIIAIRSAGAYGEAMASCYNGKELPRSYFS